MLDSQQAAEVKKEERKKKVTQLYLARARTCSLHAGQTGPESC